MFTVFFVATSRNLKHLKRLINDDLCLMVGPLDKTVIRLTDDSTKSIVDILVMYFHRMFLLPLQFNFSPKLVLAAPTVVLFIIGFTVRLITHYCSLITGKQLANNIVFMMQFGLLFCNLMLRDISVLNRKPFKSVISIKCLRFCIFHF